MNLPFTVLSVTFKVPAWAVLLGGGLITALAYFIAIPMDSSIRSDTTTFVAVWILLTVFLFGLSALLGSKAGRGRRSPRKAR